MDNNVKKLILAGALVVVAVVVFFLLKPASGPNYNSTIPHPQLRPGSAQTQPSRGIGPGSHGQAPVGE